MSGFGLRRQTPAQRANRAPALPSQADIERRVRAARPGLILYQSGNDWKSFEYGGDTYWIPPDLTMGGTLEPPMVAHPAPPPEKRNADGEWLVPADGCLHVRDRYGSMWVEPTGGTMGKRTLMHDVQVMSVMHLMVFVLANLHNRGIAILSGDPVEDEQYKEAARAAEVKGQVDLARSIVRGRKEKIARWEKNPENKGLRYPPPMEFEQEAQEFLDLHEEASMTSYGRYICDCGAFQSDDFEKFRRHMKITHNTPVTKDLADANALSPAQPVTESLMAQGEEEESLEDIERDKKIRPIPPSELAKAKEQADRAAQKQAVPTPEKLKEELK